jgi:energy-coupling factor transporter ATP-binding protein EcfA2
MNLTDEIFAWTSNLKPFQQHLLRRLSEASSLSPQDLDDGCRLLLSLHKALDEGEAAPEALAITIEDLPQSALSTGSVRLASLGNVEDVNAIVKGQTLEFGTQGLTVIYGDNGSGKSSYARILKGACRASDRSNDILPNVFTAPPELEARIPRATLSVEAGGVIETLDRKAAEPPISKLTSVSVLDTACARIYADKGNDIAYIPTALTLFNGLAEAQDRISSAIDGRIERAELELPKFPELPSDTQAGQFITGLTATTKPEEIERQLLVTEEQRARFVQLEEMLSAAAKEDFPRRAADERRKAGSARMLKARLAQRDAGLADGQISVLKRLQADAQAAEEAARILLDKFGLGESVPGIGGALWKAMWTATKDYCEHDLHAGTEFPLQKGTPAACPLCRQSLDDGAQARFEAFREVANGTAEQLANAARHAFDTAAATFRSLPTVDFGEGSTERLPFTDHAPLEQEVAAFLAASVARHAHVEAALAWGLPWEPLTPCPRPPLEGLETLAVGLDARAVEFDALAKDAERLKAEAEARELRARIALASRRDAVLKRKADLLKIAALKKAQKELNTRSVTMKQSELMDKVVTESLRTRLAQELKAFNLGHIPIKINSRGSKGVTTVDVKLDADNPHKVSAILSEGEQRALALAFFLAEIGASDHDGGIILDDPVCSLDHMRRDYVSARLIEESQRRQVIVFTHDLVFLSALQQKAENAGLTPHFRQVARSGKEVGYARSDIPWPAANCKKRVAMLKDRLVRVRKLHADEEYPYEAKKWVGLLRESWERSIEEKLFGDVIQRFRPSVETQRLKDVKFDPSLVEDIHAGMTECSNWVHDQPAAVNMGPPDVTELDAMLGRFEAFLTKVK